MNPYDHLESEQTRRDEIYTFIIDNKRCLCDRGGLHTNRERKGKRIPVN